MICSFQGYFFIANKKFDEENTDFRMHHLESSFQCFFATMGKMPAKTESELMPERK